MQDKKLKKEILRKERYKFLTQLERRMEIPMILASIGWVVTLVIHWLFQHPLAAGLFFFLWGFILLEFVLEFLLAPKKMIFLEENLLILFCLFIPAIRIFRIFNFRSRRKTRMYERSLPYKAQWGKKK